RHGRPGPPSRQEYAVAPGDPAVRASGAAVLQFHGNRERPVPQRDQRDGPGEQQALELDVAAVRQLHGENRDEHLQGHAQRPAGGMAWVPGPRRAAPVRTSGPPSRWMITSRPRWGCAPLTPATSTKQSPASGTPCMATCPPWHSTAAETPRGPCVTAGGPAGF